MSCWGWPGLRLDDPLAQASADWRVTPVLQAPLPLYLLPPAPPHLEGGTANSFLSFSFSFAFKKQKTKNRKGFKELLKRGHLGVRCPPPDLGRLQPAPPLGAGASGRACPATSGDGGAAVPGRWALPQGREGVGVPPVAPGLQVLHV